jgi:hypothetical protein
MNTVMLAPEHHWVCPNCTFTDVTTKTEVHTRFHACRGMYGLTAPMVPAGTKCKVEAVEREDFIGNEVVQRDDRGRPVMSLVTTRDNGQDTTVYAPLARLLARS